VVAWPTVCCLCANGLLSQTGLVVYHAVYQQLTLAHATIAVIRQGYTRRKRAGESAWNTHGNCGQPGDGCIPESGLSGGPGFP